MLFALSHLFILSVCISGLHGNDVTDSTETNTTTHCKYLIYFFTIFCKKNKISKYLSILYDPEPNLSLIRPGYS